MGLLRCKYRMQLYRRLYKIAASNGNIAVKEKIRGKKTRSDLDVQTDM